MATTVIVVFSRAGSFTGGTDVEGNFQSSPGIGLSRLLAAGERIFAIDRQHDRTGPAVTVGTGAPAPTLSQWGEFSAAPLLFTIGLRYLRREAGAGSSPR